MLMCCDEAGNMYDDGSDYGSQQYQMPVNQSPSWDDTAYLRVGTGIYNSNPKQVAGGNFWSALSSGLTSATSILGARYAVPQLNPGQVIQKGPGGMSFMSQASNGGALQPGSMGMGMSTTTMLLLAAGVVGVMMLSGHKGH